MKRNYRATLLFSVALLLLFIGGAAVLAQSSATFNLQSHVVGSGGGESASASYQVNGTIGQSLASPPESGSATFTVSSGYWFGDREMFIYLPVVQRNQ